MDISDTNAGAPAPGTAAKKGGVADTIRFLVTLFLFAVIIRSFIVAPFSIPSGSMLPRMMIGDYLFVAKWPYGFSRYSLPFGIFNFEGRYLRNVPKRGDIVVFHYPGRGDEDYVKRLIGLPGDLVQMKSGTLYLNGEAVPKVRIADYLMRRSPNSPCRYVDPAAAHEVTDDKGRLFCAYPRYRETLPGGRSYEIIDQTAGPADDTPAILVPEGHYFMMGDNRDDSEDSRYAVEDGGVGLLPEDDLIGRAMITFFSTDGTAQWLKPWTWICAARWSRMGATY